MSTPRPARFAVGDIIDGKYEVVKVLPVGGMGELYKVRHVHLNDFRAVKVLKANLLADTNQKQRFLREAKIAASIKHQNLASLFDFDALPDGSFFMVQEFIDGVTLMDRLRAGDKFDVPFIIRLAQQVLSGLASLHDEGIIHRDISPDNLMLTRTNAGHAIVKIIDLGIAKPVDAGEGLTSAGFFVGKLHYASPEQAGMLEPNEKIDHRTDLYSLGVVLYIVATGRMPFNADTPQGYFLKQVSQEVNPLTPPGETAKIPDALEEFVLKLLRKNRDERFASAQEALETLGDLARSLRISPSVPLSRADTATQASTAIPEPELPRSRTESQPFPLVTSGEAASKSATDAAPNASPPSGQEIKRDIPLSFAEATVATPRPRPLEAAPTSQAASTPTGNHITAEHPSVMGAAPRERPSPTESEPVSDIPMRTVETPRDELPMRTVFETPVPGPASGGFSSSQDGDDTVVATPARDAGDQSAEIPMRTVLDPTPSGDRTAVLGGSSGSRSESSGSNRDSVPPSTLSAQRTVMDQPADSFSSDRTLMDGAPSQRTVFEQVPPPSQPIMPASVPETMVQPMMSAAAAAALGQSPQATTPRAMTSPAPPDAMHPGGTVSMGAEALNPSLHSLNPSLHSAPPPPPLAPGRRPGGRTALWLLTAALMIVAVVGAFAAYKIVSNLTGPGEDPVVTNTTPPTQTVAPPVVATPEPTPSMIETPTPLPTPVISETTMTVTETILEPSPTPSLTPTPRPTQRPTKKKSQEKKAKTKTPEVQKTVEPRIISTPPPPPTVREGQLVSLGDAGVVDAKITRFHPPKYPRMAERQRASGTTTMSVLVDERGAPQDVRVTKTSGFPILDDEAQNVARRSTYAPATKNGVRVKIWKTVRVEFQRP